MNIPDEKIKLLVIVGPTASGKSDLALRLAERIGGEIVNADSVQVYRGLDIGAAKPTAEMRQRVPHHLIDIVAPDEEFTASDYRREAGRAIADIHSRGRVPMVVGGTGLYIKTLLQGLIDSPAGDEEVRRELREFAELHGNEALHRRLAQADPTAAAEIHPNNLVRVIRALEVFLVAGRPLSELHRDHRFADDYYAPLKIGLTMERAELYRRIDLRVDAMLAAGLEGEVRQLLAAGYAPELKSMRSLGYKEICAYLAGSYPLDEAVRLIKRDTRHYAKRQLTWFKRDLGINWFEYSTNFVTIYNHVIEFFY